MFFENNASELQKDKKRKMLGSEYGIWTAKKRQPVILLYSTDPATMMDEKWFGIVAKEGDGSAIYLSSHAKQAHEGFQVGEQVCVLCVRYSVSEYSWGHGATLSSSDLDWVSLQDMRQFAQLLSTMMVVEVHEHLSALGCG